jgi:hypothetical protein
MGSRSETDGEELVGGLEYAMEVRGQGQAHHVRLTLGREGLQEKMKLGYVAIVSVA